jgi:hypothetical protein
MSEFRKIMAVIAFSPYAEGLLQYAANLSKALKKDICILFCIVNLVLTIHCQQVGRIQ